MDETRTLGQSYRNWPDARKGPWRLTFHWWLIEGRVECAGVDIRSFAHDRPAEKPRFIRGQTPRAVRASELRLPIGRLIAEQRVGMADSVRGTLAHPALGDAARSEIEKQAPYWQAAGAPPVGRRGYPRSHFEAVAEIYTAASLASGRPTQAVQDRFVVSKSTAAKWVARARVLGLLPPAPGRGIPTRDDRRPK